MHSGAGALAILEGFLEEMVMWLIKTFTRRSMKPG